MSRILLSSVFNGKVIFACGFPLKRFAFCFLLITLSSFNNKPFYDSIDDLYVQANGRLSQEGVTYIRQNFIYHTEPCVKIPSDGGGLWRCVYRDGLVVYNCFRSCRGSIEAGRYFLGISGGDCDAFTIINGKKETVCYPRDADVLLRYHGQVIAIQRFRSCL
jgi:hypothetical protein